jgi:hypothetical protein
MRFKDRPKRAANQSKRSAGMSKTGKQPKNEEYPEQTEGCAIAAKARAEGNTLSDEKREDLFRRGMAMIYGGDARQTTRTRR